MSDKTVISVENLGKSYRLAHQIERQGYVALRDIIASKFKGLFRSRSWGAGSSASSEDFWALKDVSFEVKQGEVVGIIGRNGAGKSTLLKILSRITEPTEGRVRIKGRVASLLEVGTGFHPELTGRENIYLNGAILGMTRAEIRKKFDEIVDFAEVEKFLDTPVKRYSSGMYVRLAFAVAAHLEPEILIVDEVLAVGDIEFQNKCLGKMQTVSTSGRTVLFVSHNLAAITSLCNRGIFLKGGKVQANTTAENAVDAYLKLSLDMAPDEPHVLFACDSGQTGDCFVTRVEMFDENGRRKSVVRPQDYVKFRIWFHMSSAEPQGSILLDINSVQGSLIVRFETNPQKLQPLAAPGTNFVDCVVHVLPLMEGRYAVRVALAVYGMRLLKDFEDTGNLLISQPDLDETLEMLRDMRGILAIDHHWSVAEKA